MDHRRASPSGTGLASPEPVLLVGLRRLVLLPGQLGVVERKVIPLQVPGVVEDGAHLLDGGDGRQHLLAVAGGGVEEVEHRPGVGHDEPPMR